MGLATDHDIFYTLAAPAEGFYKEKGSKFLAFAYPVHSEDEIKEVQEALRKQYYDARHHCYAYRLGPQGDVFRANDDGEPNHSAGDPILGQIRSADLTDVLVVVIRYFGGTKLGVSGLIHAYKTATAEALAAGQVEQKVVTKLLRVRYPYDRTQEVLRLIDEHQMTVENQEFAADCLAELGIPKSQYDRIRELFLKIPDVQLEE